MNSSGRAIRIGAIALAIAASAMALRTQQSPNSAPADSSAGMANLEKHMEEMTAKIDSMRQQLIDSENEMEALHTELTDLRRQLAERDRIDAENVAFSLRASVEQVQEQ